ncbi:MAG: hypothetical protein ACXIUM_12195 [Wenzhouxiangella sp.]
MMDCAAVGRLSLAVVLLLLTSLAWGHRMNHEVSTAEAQVLTVSYAFGQQPIFEPYQVFAPDTDIPFQSGRTDLQGRVSFLPDRPGRWRVVVTTGDGHGVEVRIRVDEALAITEIQGPGAGGLAMTLAGVGYVLGLAGLLVLWRQRKSPSASKQSTGST